jgi:hypothetical protein
MAALVAVAFGVYTKQFYYEPSVQIPRETQVSAGSTLGPLSMIGSSALLPPDMVPMNAPESFGRGNLSDKINGKAELYLPAGFVGLQCQRFARKSDPEIWMEVYAYDMATLWQAFAVFSMQRRSDMDPSDLTRFAYGTQNALFFVHGRYYVEIISSVASETMTRIMRSFGQVFVEAISVEQQEIKETALFPVDHLEEGSLTLLVSHAFGFDRMKNVFTARYLLDGEELTAFLTPMKSVKDAETLIREYQSFLLSNGGTLAPLHHRLDDSVKVKIFDTFEIFFRRGTYVAGIHEAETEQAAEKLALMISKRLSQSDKEQVAR